MPGIRCVVFDIDDTLYLEREYVRSGFAAVGRWAAEALGITDVAARAWAEFEAGRRGDIFDHVVAHGGVPKPREAVRAMVARYRDHVPDISLLPDARACLDAIAGRSAIAAITDGPLQSQRSKAEALDLARWAKPIVFTAELGPGFGKPHPRAFRVIEEATGAAPGACCYVADNPAKDFAAPASLGWRTVRVIRPGGLHRTVPSGADVETEITDLTTLPHLLGIAT